MPNQQGNIPNMGAQNKGSAKKVLKSLLFATLIIVVIVLAVFLAKDFVFNKEVKDAGASIYSAVFITNGQVYFGKIESKNDSEVILSSVYYLQLSETGQDGTAQDQLSQPKFSLIKLGNEIHGPTDKLYIKTSQILFYEDLREDSKVVQSIKNYK